MSSATAARDKTGDVSSAAIDQDGEVIVLNEHLRSLFHGDEAFDRIMALDGDVYRHHKHRRTFRVELGGHAYFVKIHDHSGVGEIFKNVQHLRLPILTARPEYKAIQRLTSMGIPTMTVAGFGVRGRNPARLQSFIITEELENTDSLERLARRWNELPARQRALLRGAAATQMGAIARQLHENGLNHRDFYLCHFLTADRDWLRWRPSDGMQLAVIDLHRMQMRTATPRRWMVKDLAGLLHSALADHPTVRETLRFWRAYRGDHWKQMLREDRALINRIIRRAMRQYESYHGTPPPLPAWIPSSA